MIDRLPEPQFREPEPIPAIVTEETVVRMLEDVQRGERWERVNMIQVDMVADNPEILLGLINLYPDLKEQAQVLHASVFTYGLLRAQTVADIIPPPARVNKDTVQGLNQDIIHLAAAQPVERAALRLTEENPWLAVGSSRLMDHIYGIALRPHLASMSTTLTYELIRRQTVLDSLEQ